MEKQENKYIVYECVKKQLRIPSVDYIRYEIKDDEALKKFLLNSKTSLKDIEVFDNKVNFNVDITIGGDK